MFRRLLMLSVAFATALLPPRPVEAAAKDSAKTEYVQAGVRTVIKAKSLSDSSGAKGKVRLSRLPDAKANFLIGRVTCLAVSGNIAKVGFEVIKSKGTIFPGQGTTWLIGLQDGPDRARPNPDVSSPANCATAINIDVGLDGTIDIADAP